MNSSFGPAAFAPWVPDFVAWSNARSGIRRAATPAEIAAHRGLFALERVEPRHMVQFVRHAVGADGSEPSASPALAAFLEELLHPETDADLWLARFVARPPLRTGNGRCGRALWMRHRSRQGQGFPGLAEAELGPLHRAEPAGDGRALQGPQH